MCQDNNGKVVIQEGRTIESEPISRFYTTQHEGGVVATTAVHQMAFGHRIGGVRFAGGEPENHEAREREAAKLAIAMTRKNAAAGLPCDGQKTSVICPKASAKGYSLEARALILREHILAVAAHDPGVIFGPDIAIPEQVMNILSEDQDTKPFVTGLSLDHGGLGIDEFGYTARGVKGALDSLLDERGWTCDDFPRGVLVQGFGAVGKHLADLLHHDGFGIRAISTKDGAIEVPPGQQLDVAELLVLHEKYGDLVVEHYARAHGLELWPPDAVLSHEFDLFVPAAGIDVVATDQEVALGKAPTAIPVGRWQMQPKVILEGANDPITHEAERVLFESGVVVLPDFIVNCGGLIGCLLEWAFRDELSSNDEAQQDMEGLAREVIGRIVDRNVRACLNSSENPRDAAHRMSRDRNREHISRWARLAESTTTQERVRSWVNGVLTAT